MTELSGYVLEPLRKGGEFILYRGRQRGNPFPVLVLAPIAEQPAPANLKRLEHEYSLAAELDPAWAAQPLALTRHEGPTILVLRMASQTRLERHLSDYVADLQAVGRDGQYIYELGNRVRRLMRECGWSQIKDVTSDSFQVWRAKQSLAPKTVNEYLTSITSLLNWMEKHERIERSPLRHVEKVQTNGKQVRPRRAFARDEILRLLAAAGPRKVIYLTAVHTGLRRKELKLMETDDLHLDAEQPFVNVRPSTTKNHKQAVIALHPDVVAELRKLPLLPGKVFANGLPKMETFKRDLRRAGIEFIDPKGRRADFHSRRHTLGTNLALAGTAPRVAMEAMRHSDIRLTTKTYTDTGLLPVSDAVAKLPSFLGSPEKDSQIDSQTLFREGQVLSIPVINSTNGNKRKVYENQELTGVVSGPVTTGQDSAKWCAIQGSNSEAARHNQVLTTPDSQGDSQSASAPADPELKRVINAWQKLPINLRAAIVAIVDLVM